MSFFFTNISADACGEGGRRSSWALRASVQFALALRVMAAIFCFLLKPWAALLGPAPPARMYGRSWSFARRQGPR